MSQELPINFCPKCGSKIIHNAKYCVECGFELKKLTNNIEHSYDSIEENKNKRILENETSKNFNDLPLNKSNNAEKQQETITPKKDFNILIKKNSYKENKEQNNDFTIIRPRYDNQHRNKNVSSKNFTIINNNKK